MTDRPVVPAGGRGVRLVVVLGAIAGVTAGPWPSSEAAASRTRFALPAGALQLSTTRLEAGARDRVAFSVTLTRRAVAAATLELTLPRRWVARSGVSNLAYTDAPRSGSGTGGRTKVSRKGRVVRFAFRRARRADVARYAVTDKGLPAGTYRIGFRWREAGRVRTTGTTRVVVAAAARPRRGPPGRAATGG